jgi:hypothetical protein
MANALYKDTNVTVILGTLPNEGRAGKPAQPAYTSIEYTKFCSFYDGGSGVEDGDAEWQLVPSDGSSSYVPGDSTPLEYRPVPTPGQEGRFESRPRSNSGGIYSCRMEWIPVYHPPVAGTEPIAASAGTAAQTLYDFNLGWNAGARSNGFVVNDGYVQWEMPYSTIGAVLGLNGVDQGAAYPEIEHALYFSGKTVRVYERGTQVALLGPYADGDTFKILRRAGVVTYYQNGVLGYTSLLPSVDTFFLDSSLYAGGDYVFDPVIAGLSGTDPGFSGTIPEGVSPFIYRATMLPLTGIGGDYAYAEGAGMMQALSSNALSAAGIEVPRTNPYAVANRCESTLSALVGLGSSRLTAITVWPPGTYPEVLSGNVTGVVIGSMPALTIINGVISGNLYDENGVLIGNIVGTVEGIDGDGVETGDGTFTGVFVGVIKDASTGAIIGYVSGSVTGPGTGAGGPGDYTANVTGDATYVLIPDVVGGNPGDVIVDGTLTGTVGADGTLNGEYTGVITNPVTGEVTGIVTGTVTGTVNPDGTYSGTYTGVVTDPVTGVVIGVITGVVPGDAAGVLDGTITQTPNGDGTFTLVDTDADSTGTVVTVPPPTIIYVSTYGDSHGALQPLASGGDGGTELPPPVYALGGGVMQILTGAALSQTGQIGQGAGSLLPLSGLSAGSPHTAPAIPTDGIFLLDTFTSPLPVGIPEHDGEIGTGGGWTDLNGDNISGVTVGGGVVSSSDGQAHEVVVEVVTPPTGSYYVEAVGTINDTGSSFGVIAVAAPGGEGFQAVLESTDGTNVVVVLTVDDGDGTPYVTGPIDTGVNVGEEITIRVEVVPAGGGGNETVNVYVNEVLVATYTSSSPITNPEYVGITYESSTGGAEVTSIEAGVIDGTYTYYPGAGAVTGTITGTTDDPDTGTGAFTGTGELTGDFAGTIVVDVVGTVDEDGNFTGTYTGDVFVAGVLIGTVTGTLTGTVTGTTIVTGPVTGTGTFTPYYEPFNYTESRGVMRAITGYGSAHEGNHNASIGNYSYLDAAWTATPIFAVVMNAAGVVTGVVAINLAVDASLHTDIDAIHTMTFSSLLAALMQTTVYVDGPAPAYEQDGVVYVVNLESKATSTYESYPFNSYGQVDGVYYGVKSDGLFRLDGVDDDGTAIDASISFGKQNFGTPQRKRMVSAYMGASSSGKLYLKVTTGEGEYIYAARRSTDYIDQQRIDIGRGIEATYITFELFNKDGDDFEIATVEFQAVNLTRRI